MWSFHLLVHAHCVNVNNNVFHLLVHAHCVNVNNVFKSVECFFILVTFYIVWEASEIVSLRCRMPYGTHPT